MPFSSDCRFCGTFLYDSLSPDSEWQYHSNNPPDLSIVSYYNKHHKESNFTMVKRVSILVRKHFHCIIVAKPEGFNFKSTPVGLNLLASISLNQAVIPGDHEPSIQ